MFVVPSLFVSLKSLAVISKTAFSLLMSSNISKILISLSWELKTVGLPYASAQLLLFLQNYSKMYEVEN